MKYFITFLILMLVLKNSISYSQETLGLNYGFDYYFNSKNTNDFNIVRTDQNGNVLWRISLNSDNSYFDSTQSHYIALGHSYEKNGKIISNPNDYDYWLVPKSIDIDFVIYPNPNLGIFNIYVNNNFDQINYQIFDSSNRIITSSILNNINTPVNLVEMSKGIYYVKFFDNKEILKIKKLCIN